MYLIILAWLYVTLMMAVVEAFSTQGTLLGAVITFLLYGALPMSLVAYLMGTPLRRKAQRRAEAAALTQQNGPASITEPDAGGHPTGLPQQTAVTPMGKES